MLDVKKKYPEALLGLYAFTSGADIVPGSDGMICPQYNEEVGFINVGSRSNVLLNKTRRSHFLLSVSILD